LLPTGKGTVVGFKVILLRVGYINRMPAITVIIDPNKAAAPFPHKWLILRPQAFFSQPPRFVQWPL
jgi:hypothetical protein